MSLPEIKVTQVQLETYIDLRLRKLAELDLFETQLLALTEGSKDMETVNAEHRIRDLIRKEQDKLYARIRDAKEKWNKRMSGSEYGN